MGGGASKKVPAERQRFVDAQAALLQGKVESAIDICESLRQKLVVPGKGTRKGFEGLLAEIDDFLAQAQKAKEELVAAHEEALEMMKTAEELLSKGEMQDAKHNFQSAYDRYQKALRASMFAEHWLLLINDMGGDGGPQWLECHESMSINGSILMCEESDVGSAKTSELAETGKLVCEIRIKTMMARAEGEDSDIYFGVIQDDIGLEDFWFDDELEDRAWFYSDDGDMCTGEEVLEDVSPSWAYKQGDTVRLELVFTDGEDGGVLKFYKNGREIPQHFKGVVGPVVAAVLMSDCQAGDCIELAELQYDPSDSGDAAKEDLTDVLHQQRPVLSVIDAFTSSCKAHVQYISFEDEASTTTISTAKKAMARSMTKLHKATDQMRFTKLKAKKMELSTKLKANFLEKAQTYVAEAQALVEEGKLIFSFQVFDRAIALMQKIEEPELLKQTKKARQAAVARKDLSGRNADRMMKLVRTRIKIEVMATLYEGYEEVTKMAVEAEALFLEAGDPAKSQDAHVTKAVCDDLQQAAILANSANKAFGNALLSGVKHHFQKASDEYAQASILCVKTGNTFFAEELKKLAYKAMEAFKAVEVADAEIPVEEGVEEMDAAMNDYADLLDGKPDEEEADAGGSVEPCLTGVVSRRIMPQSKIFSVYVSSSISEHEPERICIAREVARMVRTAVVCFGFEFEFVDPFFSLWNAPELAQDFDFRHMSSAILKQCQAESAGVDFLSLVGQDDNGISFPGRIDFEVFSSVVSRLPDRGELGKLRKVIVDWYKLDSNSTPPSYVMLDRKKKILNLNSVDLNKKAIGVQEWNRQFMQLQKGFYEATKIQIAAQNKQRIRTGILGKLGKVDSYAMKQKVYELFCDFDVDGSGQIDESELQIAFGELGVKFSKEEVKEFMDEFDDDKSGEIGFEEFLLIVEKLLLDAKNHAKEEPIKNVDHAKYFMQSLIYQDLCEGILDRPRDVALKRSVATLWGFDPMQMGQELRYIEPEHESDVPDSMAQFRRINVALNGGDEALEQNIRPEWFKHTEIWQVKEMVFKQLVDMEEYIEDNPPDDTITPETPTSRPLSRGSDIMMVNVDVMNVDRYHLEESSKVVASPPSRDKLGAGRFPPPTTGDDGMSHDHRVDTSHDKFGGRRIDPDIWEVFSLRKSMFLKTLSDWEFMRVMSRSKRKTFKGSTDNPYLIVQPNKDWSGSEDAIKKTQETIKSTNEKIDRLIDNERRERNAMSKARMQAEIKTCEETIQCLQSDIDRTMYVVLNGELEVLLIQEVEEKIEEKKSRTGSRDIRPNTKKASKVITKLAVLKRGDAFGDLTLVLGIPRDTTIQAISPVDVAEIRYDMVQSLLFRNPNIEKRCDAFVQALTPQSTFLQTHFLTRAIPYDDASWKSINSAMAMNRSPLMKVLRSTEIQHLSKVVSITRLPATVELCRQDDGQETGWGPFGNSAFIIIEGELSVNIRLEDEGSASKTVEVARIFTVGESAGEMSLVTGAPRDSTIVTVTPCILIEITIDQLTSIVHRDIRDDVLSLSIDPQSGSVESRVLSQRTQHAMYRRNSTFLKQLSDIEIDFLASVAKIRIEDKGTSIVQQGDWGDSCFVVLRGHLRVMVAFAEGEELREVGRLKGGDVFGEMTLLLDYPRASTVIVISKNAMLAEITRDGAEKMLNVRKDIFDTMDMMLHGDEGFDDIMRARTPLGGRAATPGGVVATGLKFSIGLASYPWKSEPKGLHADVRGQKYLTSFAQKVTNSLIERIEPALEEDFRAMGDKKLPLLHECSFHLDVAARKTEAFKGRKDEMKRIVDTIEGEYQQRMGLKNQPCIVMGEDGVGKSSLLAMSGIRIKARHPGAIVVFRFIGWTQGSLNVTRLMKSILTQLMTLFGMKIPIFSENLEQLRAILLSLLERATKQELISVILDAVDNLDTPAGHVPSFEWLPRKLPKYSSIVLSLRTSSIDTINVLNGMFTGEVYLNIYALRPVDAQPVLEGYLDKRNKNGFSVAHFEAIRKSSFESAGLEGVPYNCSPLFLNLCVNVSDDWLSFDPPPVLPQNIPDLVKMVYEQLEKKHGRVFVERALSYLFSSREGLTWQELYDLVSCDDDVLDEVYKPVVPIFRRIPGFKAKMLSNDLQRILTDPYFNGLVSTQKFRYIHFRQAVFEKYSLENTVRQCSMYKFMALYFSGEWADGKEILSLQTQTHQWRPTDDQTKYDRGISPQQIFFEGQSRLIFHRREKVANIRKIRELPHHICWSSGRSSKTIDPIGRALAQRPPSAWNSRSENDRNAQIMFLKHCCKMEMVEAASLAGFAHEFTFDMLLGQKIFPYSELMRQFYKFLHENVENLSISGYLAFQCALNSAGNGQGLINELAQDMLEKYYGENNRDGIPDVWLVHTNKDEVMDSLYVQYKGHWGPVLTVAISNRDDVVLTGGADCSIRFYDASSGYEAKAIHGHVEAVLRVSFSLDDKKVISSSADSTAIIWDIQTGDQITRLEGHAGEVLDGIFLTNSVVMTASNDSTLRTWTVDTGVKIKVFTGHRSAVSRCISAAKGIQAISSSYDKTIRIWEIESALELLMLAGHQGVIYDMDLSRDQRKLLSCDSDQIVKVWDLDEGLELQSLHLHEYAVTACAFDPTGHWIVTGGIDKTVRLLELGCMGDAVIVGEHKAAVVNIKFSNDGDFILSASVDGLVSKWEWAVAHQVATDSTPDHTAPICHIEFSPTGKHFASLSSDGVTILRVLDWRCVSLAAHQLTDAKDPASACKFSPNGLTIATLHAFGSLLWDTKTGNIVGRFGQVFNLLSLDFPEVVEYAIAPPMEPIVKPDNDLGADAVEDVNETQDLNAFSPEQIEILQNYAKDRFKKRFRADYVAIAKEIDRFGGGRGVDWKDVRNEIEKMVNEENRKADEEKDKRLKEALEESRLKKIEEVEGMKRKHEELKRKRALEAAAAMQILENEARELGIENEANGSATIHASIEKLISEAHGLGIAGDDMNIPIIETELGSKGDEIIVRPSTKGMEPEGVFEDALNLWLATLHRIVLGTDTEVALIGQLIQGDHATLAHGKLNSEICVFGRELTADERDALCWNLKENTDPQPNATASVAAQKQQDDSLAAATTKQQVHDVAVTAEKHQEVAAAAADKKNVEDAGAQNKESTEVSSKKSLFPWFQNKKGNVPQEAKDEIIQSKKTEVDSEERQMEQPKEKPKKESAVAKRKAKEVARRALIFEMFKTEAEVALFGHELTELTRDAEWKGPRRKTLEQMLTKIEVAKKKALELNLQKFLEKEGYGEISQNLQKMKPISPPDNARDIKETSVNVSEMKPISPPDNSRDIIYCGVRRQMEGLKLLLRGVPEEWTEVKRAAREAGEERQRLKKEADVRVEEVGEENGEAELTTGKKASSLHRPFEKLQITQQADSSKGLNLYLGGIAKTLTGPKEEMEVLRQLMQDEQAKTVLMKANAEVGVFGRELTEHEREAAWGEGHENMLSFLKPAAEVVILGYELPEEERDQAWSKGPHKIDLATTFSNMVIKQKEKLEQTLQTIQQANTRIEKSASRLQSATSRGSQGSETSILSEATQTEAQVRFTQLFDRRLTQNTQSSSKPQSATNSETEAALIEAQGRLSTSLSRRSDGRIQTSIRLDPSPPPLPVGDGDTDHETIDLEDGTHAEVLRISTSSPQEPTWVESPRTPKSGVASEIGSRMSGLSASAAVEAHDRVTRVLSRPQTSDRPPSAANSETEAVLMDAHDRLTHSFSSLNSVTLGAANFGNSEDSERFEADTGGEHQEEIVDADHQTEDFGSLAEVMYISAATPNTDQNDLDEFALQVRISMYTDVDVEVTENRPGTSGSVQLRPRTTTSEQGRPRTSLTGDRPITSQTNTSSDRPTTSQTNRSGQDNQGSQIRPLTGKGKDFGLEDTVYDKKTHHVEIWHEEEVDASEVNFSFTDETALWSLGSLLNFIQNIDPKEVEERARKDAEEVRRRKMKKEARKKREEIDQNELKEVFDVDKPERAVVIEVVQNILFMLDQLEATTNRASPVYGKSAEVLAKIGNERTCRRNIAFPSRGIPSLNFLVVETMKPYLSHPEKDVRLMAIDSLSKIIRPGDAEASKLIRALAGDEDPDIKIAAIAALAKIVTADDGDDEEDLKNPLVRKMLTVTIKAASNLFAADASGTSDPFATLALQAYNADIDEIKTMRSQQFGSAKELIKQNYRETMEDAPHIVELALKRMQLKRALLLEMTTSWDQKEILKDCNFITLERNHILFVQGDEVESLFVVISGKLRVMLKFDTHKKPKDEEESPKEKKNVPIAGMHDLGQQVALLDMGDTIGEMSFILSEPQGASVVAAEDSNILEIPRQALATLRKRRPTAYTDLRIRALKQQGLLPDEADKGGPKNMQKTDVQLKTLNPVWEETVSFYNVDVTNSLVVSIFDHDIVGCLDFLGRVMLEVQSLPINQDVEKWLPLEKRSENDEVSGSVCLNIRLQTDKRPRVHMEDGETLVAEVNENVLTLRRDSSRNEIEQKPSTLFRLGSKVGAWHVSPADPRNIAIGNQSGGVFLLRVQDIMHYRWEREMMEQESREQTARTAENRGETPSLVLTSLVVG